MIFFKIELVYFLTVLSIVYLIIRRFYLRRQFQSFARSRACQAPPHSANSLPWGIDRMWRLVKLTGKGADVMESVVMPDFLTYGSTFQASGLFGAEPIFTADPENLRAIFATQFKDFLTGDNRAGAFGYMVGKCIFTTDGPFWEHSRTLFRPHFSTGQINNLDATEKAVRDLLTALEVRGGCPSERGTGQGEQWSEEVDLQPLFLRFTLDSGTEFLFGVSVNSQLGAIPGASSSLENGTIDEVSRIAADAAGGEQHAMNFSEAFHVASVEVTKRAKLQSLYWLADSKKARQAVRYLQRFVDHFVSQALQHSPGQASFGNGEKKHQQQTLLSALAQDTQDPIELRDQVLFALVAARDTTAAMLSWMFLMLAKHPTVFEKLRSEILANFGNDTNSTEPPLTMNSLKKCRYLQWVMHETLRLYPPGPLNSRVVARDTTLPTGGGVDGKRPIALFKGQSVNLCVYAMQRREDLWGHDALEFKPERWEKKKSDWNFLPFSGGPRTCLGRELQPPFPLLAPNTIDSLS